MNRSVPPTRSTLPGPWPGRWWTAVACLFAWLVLSLPAHAAFGAGEEPLRVEAAFPVEIVAADRETVRLRFDIADGYYLYRDKLAFTLQDDAGEAVPTGDPLLPDGEAIEDEFFGRSVVYRGSIEIAIPLRLTESGPTERGLDEAVPNPLALLVDFQGCADLGLCYPPTTTTLEVVLEDRAGTLPSLGGTMFGVASLTHRLSNWLGGDTETPGELPDDDSAAVQMPTEAGLSGGGVSADELLRPEEAFVLQPGVARADRIALDWSIAPGYYLYRDKLDYRLPNGESRVSDVDMPPGARQRDEFFGETAVLRERVPVTLTVAPALDGDTVRLEVDWQGCADVGVCFPPSTLTLDIPVSATDRALATVATSTSTGADIGSSGTPGMPADAGTTGGAGASTANVALAVSEQDRLSAQLGTATLWLNAATFFVLGLLLAFTPCVLPMVPILSSLIVGQGTTVGTGRAFRLSLVYVLAMAATYTSVGVLIGLSGYNVQAWFQNPWVLSVFAGIFVLLALSMFGFYSLQVPLGVQQRLHAWSNRYEGGRYGGVAVMGLLSALIVGPCVTAPLVGALIYIAETGDAVVGGVALFSLSMGMGLPLLLIGTSAGHLLPRVGGWMDRMRVVFGVLLLAMAIYMLSRVLPDGVTMGLSAVLAVMSGIWLGGADRLDRDSSGTERFAKGVGLVVTLYGAALFVGVLAGSQSMITPLRGLTASGVGSSIESGELDFARVKTVDDLDRVVATAAAANRPVMLDFYADWCVSCKEMEAFTFSDPEVHAALASAVLVQADVTANDSDDQALLRRFGLFGPPAIVLFDRAGDELRGARLVGFMGADRFVAHIERFIGQA